jgi:hypothetical protein
MGVVKLSTAGILDYQKYSSFLAGNAAFSPSAYDLLETEILTGSQSSVTFSSLNSTYGADYQHLQVRMALDSTVNSSIKFRFNGDTSGNYSFHYLEGNGSSVVSSAVAPHDYGYMGYSFAGYAVFVTDILDPFETTKYTTTRTLSGTTDGGNRIYLTSSNWRNTAALTSLQIINESGSFTTGSRFSLYGLKAA